MICISKFVIERAYIEEKMNKIETMNTYIETIVSNI